MTGLCTKPSSFGHRPALLEREAFNAAGPEHCRCVACADCAFHPGSGVLEEAQAAAVPIYLLGFAGEDSRTWSERGRREIETQFERLAGMTGGKAFFPENSTNCSGITRQILERGRYVYRFGFYSAAPLAASPDVQVRIPGGRTRRVIIRTVPPALRISVSETAAGHA